MAGTADAVPRALAVATVRLAARVAAGTAGVAVPGSVLALMDGGFTIMFLTKTKVLGLSALTATVLVAGACVLSAQDSTPRPGAVRRGPTGPARAAGGLPRDGYGDPGRPGDDHAGQRRRGGGRGGAAGLPPVAAAGVPGQAGHPGRHAARGGRPPGRTRQGSG